MSQPVTIQNLCSYLGALAPLRLAEDWDNVGLLLGDRASVVQRVMTCLTPTPDVAEEAAGRGAGLVITHHPIPFRPVAKLTTDSVTGKVLWHLATHGIAVYSAHTAMDSAREGINQCWAESLGLGSICPITPTEDDPAIGSGRIGKFDDAIMLHDLAKDAAAVAGISKPRVVGETALSCRKVAIACGSGGSFLGAAIRNGCDAMVTGEATFHTCLEARAANVGLVLVGHYGSERFAMERLATNLNAEFPTVEVWASQVESDPIETIDVSRPGT